MRRADEKEQGNEDNWNEKGTAGEGKGEDEMEGKRSEAELGGGEGKRDGGKGDCKEDRGQ